MTPRAPDATSDPAGAGAGAAGRGGRPRPTFRPLRVASVRRLCSDAVEIGFEVPPEYAAEFRFRPGQALTLRRREGELDERRSYSLCGPAGSAPRIGVREVPDGLVSRWLNREVAIGDVVEALPPTGRFALGEDVSGHHVLVAAGSGITPLLSIAATVLSGDPTSRVTLVYGNRHTGSVMFAEDLADLKDRYPARTQLLHVLSREPREAELTSGRVDGAKVELLLSEVVPPETVDHWWLCGPWDMVEVVRTALADHGVPAARVHRELFHVEDEAPPVRRHQDGSAPTGPVTRVRLLLDGRTTSLTVPRDVPVLDAAQPARPDLPFACRGGVCGTCRARVVSGEVRMRRNFALEPSEVDAGFVLTCQSLPTTEELEIDYDG
ncbi:phenylacetate-CoA oxygenase/reductase subunit PaaK [Actinoalloteichus sp. AHMU CJ021]|uniref:1,2-phenylacetyl-CoA epoxidase subunit PaaE n=1 Tax=Actinoalloteichus sp. AHMU CJ021 TaxID=2072503 RepID=UPI000CA01782|nr:phenylacetate-CoA oxygenase/reductase subunit PaaK [Actinoalloteichus sp. AHMU CJ021]